MLLLLLAFQASTTNCHPDYVGGFRCTTMTPPPLQQPQTAPVQTVDQDWYGIFKARRDRKRAEAVGKMLAQGDCAGAEKYALQKGDLDLAERARSYCASAVHSEPQRQ